MITFGELILRIENFVSPMDSPDELEAPFFLYFSIILMNYWFDCLISFQKKQIKLKIEWMNELNLIRN